MELAKEAKIFLQNSIDTLSEMQMSHLAEPTKILIELGYNLNWQFRRVAENSPLHELVVLVQALQIAESAPGDEILGRRPLSSDDVLCLVGCVVTHDWVPIERAGLTEDDQSQAPESVRALLKEKKRESRLQHMALTVPVVRSLLPALRRDDGRRYFDGDAVKRVARATSRHDLMKIGQNWPQLSDDVVAIILVEADRLWPVSCSRRPDGEPDIDTAGATADIRRKVEGRTSDPKTYQPSLDELQDQVRRNLVSQLGPKACPPGWETRPGDNASFPSPVIRTIAGRSLLEEYLSVADISMAEYD